MYLFRFSIKLSILVIFAFTITNCSEFTQHENEKEDADERPKYEIDAEEKAFNERISLKKQREIRLKSASLTDSYANGKIQGTWHAKAFGANWTNAYGYRVISSAYNKEKDIFYVVSFAGHIWKIEYDINSLSNTHWTSLNHSHVFMTESSKEWFDILNFEEGGEIKSRMLRSFNNGIEYSNDEGRNWSKSTGSVFQVTGDKGCVVHSSSGSRAVVLAKINNVHKVAISYDGISYTNTDLSIAYNDYETKILKPHFNDNVYVVARNKSTSKLSIYRMKPDSEQFELIQSPTVSVNAPSKVLGTFTGGKYHFYYMVGDAVYYSSDEGSTWKKSIGGDYGNTEGNTTVRTVHPTLPNTLFRGYLDVYSSSDKGANFTGWGHRLGWDTHHMRMHQRKDGSYMHLIGNDFGVFFSITPELKDSYHTLNHWSPIQMAYDMDVSNNFNTAFTAMQDRGTHAFVNTPKTYTNEIRSTDGLRVTLANKEKSVWTWMYFGSVFHTSNFGYKEGSKTDVNLAGNWTGVSMVASPDSDEDAVYIAIDGTNNLKKVKFNETSNSISVTDHPFNFKDFTGQTVSAFGYSPLNKDLWYVAMKDGTFTYSIDGGKSFKKSVSRVARGNDQGYNYARNQQIIKGSKFDENTVYVVGVENALYISKNNGLSFTKYSSGLDVYRIRDFDLSDDEKFIFAACGTGGAWVFSVNDKKWYKMDGADVPYVDFTSVNHVESKGMVQFGTFGYGVLDFTFERWANAVATPVGVKAEANSASIINLTWSKDSSGVDGFIVRRSTDLLNFDDIATVNAQSTSYTDANLYPTTEYYYRIVAYQGDQQSLPSNLQTVTTPEITELDKTDWELISVSSELSGSEGIFSFDNNTTTKWSSNGTETYPHEIRIDMGSSQDVEAFNYKGGRGGIVKSYAIYVSNDSLNWGNPAYEGVWETTKETSKTVFFEKTKGRYVRFVALSGFDETDKLNMIELILWPSYDKRLEPPVEMSYSAYSSTSIQIKWEANSTNVEGYIIERLGADGYEEIDNVSATKKYILDNGLEPYTTYSYRIIAYRRDDKSVPSAPLEATTARTGMIARTGWELVFTDSNAFGKRGDFAYDDDEFTCWMSKLKPSIAPLPHEIQIDMGKTESLIAFTYIPSADTSTDGTIKDFAFYVSDDKLNWGEPVTRGTWTDRIRHNVEFPRKSGRYIRLVANSEINGNATTNIAELMVWNQYDGNTTTVINDLLIDNIKLYPVPFEDKINVKLENKSDYLTAQLISVDGRVLVSQKISAKKFELVPQSNLTSGIYLVRFQGDGKQLVKKVIKK